MKKAENFFKIFVTNLIFLRLMGEWNRKEVRP